MTRDALHWAVEVSARAQQAAGVEQDAEFDKLINEHLLEFRCIGCKKELEFHQWGEEPKDGYHNGGGLMIDRFGYGSNKYDMAKIAVLVCDDCVKEHGITSDWLEKLDKHWHIEAKTEAPIDFQI